MAKLNDIRALAESHAAEISRSTKTWTGYLDTAATLYRYDFPETLLIHAQRPEATACAELEIWNSRMGRWVNRGSKGIALIDDSGPRKRLRYVFDISDTHMVRGGKTPYIWQMEPQIRQEMAGYLMDTYGLEYDPDAPLSSVLMALARVQVNDNLEDAMDGLAYEVRGTYLEGLGEDAVRENFRRLMENSTYYMLARRCGLDPWIEVTPDDFSGIANFNRLSVLSFLGNAAHDIVEPILKDIGREVILRYRILAAEKEIDRYIEKAGYTQEEIEKAQKELAEKDGSGYNKFNTLIRESVNGDQAQDNEESRETGENTEGGREDGSDIHEERRLPVPEPDDQRGAGSIREVRDAQEVIPEGEQKELVSEHDADREAGEAPAGDRRDGGRAGRADLGADGTAGRRGREVEGGRPDGMGTADEQHPEPRGRDRTEGIGVQLISEDITDDNEDTGITDEAEDNGSPAFSIPAITYFPDLPTAAQQRRQIEERMDALYAGEVNIPPEVIDEFLRTGGNRRGSQLRIIYHFMTDPSPEEAVEYVRREYGKGGKGLIIDGKDYSVWFDEAGIKFAEGHSVEDPVMAKAYLSWDDVSGRIRQLLAQGEYAPQSVLDAARENALTEHATALAYMERDLADGIAEIVFDDTSIFRGGFPDAVTKISEKLDDPVFLADLIERLEGLSMAYAESPEIMRFNFYNPDRMLAQFRQFSKEAVPFTARDGFGWQEHGIFITQEEADAFLASGGPYSDGRIATYSHFLRHEDTQERAEFLKNQYGTGGRSHALSGADDSYADYSAKGIVLTRGNGDRSAVLRMSYEMICSAWYSVREFHIHLSGLSNDGGVRDGLERAVLLLSDLSELPANASRVQIKNEIRKFNRELKKPKEQLTNMVPYRALAGFFMNTGEIVNWDSIRRMTAYIEAFNKEITPLPYTLGTGSKLKKEVRFHPDWIRMIQDNTVSILGWIQYEKVKWLQNNNPEVPGLVYKLAPMDEKMRKLGKVRKLWEGILDCQEIRDVFTGESIQSAKYDIDHFIPWSFVMNDELWNLMPMDSSLNSAKSNRLPQWDPFFIRFSENQFVLYRLIHEKPGIHKLYEGCWRDNLHSIWAGQELYRPGNSRETFSTILQDNMRPVYDSARRQGYEIWKLSG